MSFWQGSETIIIKRRSGNTVDEYGNKTFSLTTITVNNCMVGLNSTMEANTPERETTDTGITLYLPNGTAVQSGDRFMVCGVEFIQNGEAQVWEAPFDLKVGVVVNVKKRNG